MGLAALYDRVAKRLGEWRQDFGQQVHDGIRRQPAPDPEPRWLATWRHRRNRSGVDAMAAQQWLDARKRAMSRWRKVHERLLLGGGPVRCPIDRARRMKHGWYPRWYPSLSMYWR